jgi:Synergist-CTERM protein sorting domain-containing protein
VELTWSEDRLHVGRVVLPRPAVSIELRGGAGLDVARVELYPERRAGDGPLARDLPFGTRRQALAPRDLVIPRAEWGARDPGRVCGDVVSPYRMSIHHTASPADDGGDPAARMRQIQAYHIDSNGWCDIGYHFVVSQSGLVFQGRSDERRPGAHVGNQNSGNVGICLIGNFQQQQVGAAQMNAAAAIVGWVSRTYDIPLNRDKVKGHREWPGQGTECPGNNLLGSLDELLRRAGGGGEPPPPPRRDVVVSVAWHGITDRDGDGRADVSPGDRFEAEIRIENRSDGPIRGVQAGFWIEEPWLKAVGYAIETDHPAYDRATWRTNDADAAPGNPPKDAMGASGFLTMYAFAANEAKRVRVTLEAGPPSVGRADHPDVRGWVRHIDDVYGDQDAWDQQPTTNALGRLLQAYAELDVVGPEGADAGPLPPAPDAAAPDAGALPPEPDAALPPPEADAGDGDGDFAPPIGQARADHDGGCRTGGRAPAPLALLLLAPLALRRRRRA